MIGHMQFWVSYNYARILYFVLALVQRKGGLEIVFIIIVVIIIIIIKLYLFSILLET